MWVFGGLGKREESRITISRLRDGQMVITLTAIGNTGGKGGIWRKCQLRVLGESIRCFVGNWK